MKKHLFDTEFRLDELSKKDPLIFINKHIDWSFFESQLNQLIPSKDMSKGGRPPYSKLLLFKIVFLQQYYQLSDEAAEYQIKDRLSFMRFLGLGMADALPDQNTIWNFKEKLKVENRLEKLFDLFTAQLREKGLIVNKGQIVDASIVNVPVQRNSRDENDQIKNNETPDWDKKKAQHKDVDARWTSKNNKHYYGYKNHIKVDKRSKLITKARVTSAEVHDSQVIQELIDKTDQGHLLCADSAYSGKATIEQMRSLGVYPRINKKGTRNNPLSDFEKNKNNQELGHVSSMFLVI